jgi:putative peptide zinc metalloprotease protein
VNHDAQLLVDERDEVLVPLGERPQLEAAPTRVPDPAPPPQAQKTQPHPTAGDFTSERILRAQAEPARDAWRRLVFQLTGGLVNPGPSATELRERELIGRVKSPIAGCRRIAVVSRKGGVGKTTTTLMLGHTFASYRGDRVIALDGNPDAGSLAYRVRRETTNTLLSLLAHRKEIGRYRGHPRVHQPGAYPTRGRGGR